MAQIPVILPKLTDAEVATIRNRKLLRSETV